MPLYVVAMTGRATTCIDRDDAQVSSTGHFLYLRYKISPSLERNAVRLDFGFHRISDLFFKLQFSTQGKKLLKQLMKAK
jgi:hypothetical protein